MKKLVELIMNRKLERRVKQGYSDYKTVIDNLFEMAKEVFEIKLEEKVRGFEQKYSVLVFGRKECIEKRKIQS
jgi:hypothetical protein